LLGSPDLQTIACLILDLYMPDMDGPGVFSAAEPVTVLHSSHHLHRAW
jgi:FixJ family two-component response regulator